MAGQPPCPYQLAMPLLTTTKRSMAALYQVSPACPAPPLSLEALRGLLRSARRFELGLLAHGVAFERHVLSALIGVPQLASWVLALLAGGGEAPHSGRSRAAREPSERGRATRTSLSARDVNPAAIFNLRLYDGRLEALLDEVAHAGAAPVAASVKREIVRQHLQLQVFEAVPA